MSTPLRCAAAGALLLLCAPAAPAQFTDLQPGRNFPTAKIEFGANRTENVDVGDVDNDGDLDVVLANGGDFGNEPNRIYINNGGLQGGTQGTFSEATSTRFAGVPSDTSRDIELADIDNDGDLDIYVSNRGSNTAGQTSRFYINQGGLQAGTLGFFAEETGARWGALSSVPGTDQIAGGNAGPWRDWSCDCDFGDLDDDGDLDLFHSSYGPSIGGNRPSRVFMNDGAGVFDELFPWVDAGGDINNHTMDLDIVDLDGDYDLDVFNSSRDSQARVYINNTYQPTTGSTRMYTDTTGASLIGTGSTLSGTSNYEGEFADLDDDGDFDVWMKNYANFTDKILVNTGTDANGAVLFTESNGPGPSMIKGDPSVDENELDFLDFDGDGDLDAFAANFSGTNWIYAGGAAQGLVGEYHRTGTSSGGGLYPFNETPPSGNGGTTLDGEAADMDGDGDEDLLLANDSNQANRYWENVLGVPDTHAPFFLRTSHAVGTPNIPGNKVVHAQVGDNSSYYLIAYYDVTLTYQPGNVSVSMFSQAGQQFRAEIPGGATSYAITATDLGGNTGTTGTISIGGGGSPWSDLGQGLAGVSGVPVLAGSGPATSGSANALALTNAAPASPAALFAALGPAGVGAPFKGGTLLAVPVLIQIGFGTDGAGAITLPFVMSPGLSGVSLVFQYGISDGAAVKNVALSNGVQLDVP